MRREFFTIWHMLRTLFLILVLCSLLSLCSGGPLHPLNVGKAYVALPGHPKNFRSFVMDITKFILAIVSRSR